MFSDLNLAFFSMSKLRLEIESKRNNRHALLVARGIQSPSHYHPLGKRRYQCDIDPAVQFFHGWPDGIRVFDRAYHFPG